MILEQELKYVRRTDLPVCFSKQVWNWLIGGGIFKRVWRTVFCLCKRMYLGHLTNRLKSRLGWMACPISKLRGLATKSGFFTLLTSGFFTARGAAATFFPFFLAWKKLIVLMSVYYGIMLIYYQFPNSIKYLLNTFTLCNLQVKGIRRYKNLSFNTSLWCKHFKWQKEDCY